MEDPGRSEEFQEILQRIPAGGVGQFVHKGLDRKGMVGARHRSQPAETHMSFRRATLDAKVLDIKWHLNPFP
jgi:hypothetical protein